MWSCQRSLINCWWRCKNEPNITVTPLERFARSLGLTIDMRMMIESDGVFVEQVNKLRKKLVEQDPSTHHIMFCDERGWTRRDKAG